jgi:hypothetical protein
MILCNLTAGDIVIVADDGERMSFPPGPTHVPAARMAKLEALAVFASLCEQGKIAVVDREARIPWERMAEPVRRERARQLTEEQDRLRQQERQAQFRKFAEDAWSRALQPVKPAPAGKTQVPEDLRRFEVEQYRRVGTPKA